MCIESDSLATGSFLAFESNFIGVFLYLAIGIGINENNQVVEITKPECFLELLMIP